MIGERFGRLTVMAVGAGRKLGSGLFTGKLAVCACECGAVVEARAVELRRSHYPKLTCGRDCPLGLASSRLAVPKPPKQPKLPKPPKEAKPKRAVRSRNLFLERAMAEQAGFERRQRELKHARIRKVAADNPDLHLDALAERFDMSVSTISTIIGGVSPERRNVGINPRDVMTPDRLCVFPFYGPRRTA